VPRVDVVCGVGYDRALGDGTSPASPERGRNLSPGRFHEIRRVVTNLGVFDFRTPDRSMRLVSRHPGVAVDEIVRSTGFPLLGLETAATTREPSPEELRLIRDVLDPKAAAAKELVTR
jgi:hypothetical protein